MKNTVKIEYEEMTKAIELPDGTILDIPTRTVENSDKISKLLQERTQKKEYDFIKEILTVLFGADGFKKIAPKGKNENLDYLNKVYVTAVDLFMLEKSEIENEEMQKSMKRLEPIFDSMNNMNQLPDILKKNKMI